MKKITLLFFLLVATFQSFSQLASGTTAPNFTTTDIYGVTHTLSDYLAAGKSVIIDISATWCSPCWNYHNGHALDDVYEAYGPNASNEIVVIFVEGDAATTNDDLYGTGTNTQGNWVANSPYIITDDADLASLYQIAYFPTVYRICPSGILTELTQPSATSIRAGVNANCGALTGTQNNVLAQDNLSGFCSTTGSPIAKLKNYGTNIVSAAVVNLKENGTVVATKTSTGNFAQFGSKTVTFDPLVLNPASTYTVEVNTVNTLPNYNTASIGDMSFYFSQETLPSAEVRVYTDNYPSEISWRIKNSAGIIVANGGPYAGTSAGGGVDANTTKIQQITLPTLGECYTVELADSYGDGWGLGNTPHGLEIFNNGVSVYSAMVGNFGSLLSRPNALRTAPALAVNTNETTKSVIYPNPSTGIVHIATDETVSVNVVDVTGKIVYTLNNVTTQTSLDLSNLQKGIYLAKISGENVNYTEKIILK
jgi:Secretion system C-terminal sorting domain/AhpC/TSA family